MQKKRIFFNQKGATAVEFALILPLLITLIFGIIEFSLCVFNYHIITNAAREGARAGIVARPPMQRLSNADISDVVIDYAAKHLITFGSDVLTVDDVEIKPIYDITDVDADVFDPLVNRCILFECDLEVEVNYEYKFLFLSSLGIGPIDLHATSLMKME